MKKLIAFLLALMLLTGSALAQTGSDERESMMMLNGNAMVLPVFLFETVDPNIGLTTWEIEDPADESGERLMLHSPWLTQRGLAGDTLVDFDGDGVMEWAVLSVRDGKDDDSDAMLWLSIYELEEGEARLADEVCLFAVPFDQYGDLVQIYFLQKDDHVLLYAGGAFCVDSRWQQNWIINYYGERLWVEGGFFISQDETGAYALSTVGKASSFVLTQWDPWALPESAETTVFTADQTDALSEQLALTAASFGLNTEEKPEGLTAYYPTESEKLLLLEMDCYAQTEAGVPAILVDRMLLEGTEPDLTGVTGPVYTYVLANGTINLRSEPSLAGEILEIIQDGEILEFLGADAVDDRDVIWYKVKSEKNEGWVSSKYSILR